MKVRNVEPIIFRGGGDIATGSISMVHKAGYPVLILETDNPTAIRREVAFCDAVYSKEKTVEDMTCHLYDTFEEAYIAAKEGKIAMIVDPQCNCLNQYKPHVLVDAILAKKNIGTTIDMADIVVGLGPGFCAGKDVNYAVETMRGHTLGRVINKGEPIPDTATPGIIGGYGRERVIHAPASGYWHIVKGITDIVEKGEIIAKITSEDGTVTNVYASLTGVIRGTIREGFYVKKGLKSADIDPRKEQVVNCYLISDKAKTVGGAVLQIVSAAYIS